MTIENKTHIYFLTNWLSNFYKTKITYKGLLFNTTEAIFMWEKARYFGDTSSCMAILQSKDPQEAKQLGRGVRNYNDTEWAKVRYAFMYQANLSKFSQNEDLKKKLLNTGTKQIVEANPRDQIWSCGLAENDPLILDPKNWTGQNLLGKVLMEVREALK